MLPVRLMLKDRQWEWMHPDLPGKAGDPGRTGAGNRSYVEVILRLA